MADDHLIEAIFRAQDAGDMPIDPDEDLPPGWRLCRTCKEGKPESEYYDSRNNATGHVVRTNQCKDCDNARVRVRPPQDRINNRVRTLATKELVKRHPDEFFDLKMRFLAQVTAEYREAVEASGDEQVRLKVGPRRDGQGVVDRIDIARCRSCKQHHDRGHECPRCGSFLEEEIPDDEAV